MSTEQQTEKIPAVEDLVRRTDPVLNAKRVADPVTIDALLSLERYIGPPPPGLRWAFAPPSDLVEVAHEARRLVYFLAELHDLKWAYRELCEERVKLQRDKEGCDRLFRQVMGLLGENRSLRARTQELEDSNGVD